ncbi:MAG: sigma-70 family RNA polymerase sigma factor [Verrucomicrobia bacterium]|nr:sigma-70 family RNA polymerase sigma factor [Verrucomicrobiota bacterium]MBI3870986.1 sigma-70 family RNA polymerase sigma factor [Verrucomicrobiota bacterium]
MGRLNLKEWLSLAEPSDERLMLRVAEAAHPESYARLMSRWEGPIHRLCFRMTGDWFRAQDLTQEVFLRLFAKRDQYRPTARFSTYLWQIALNLCRDDLRRDRRRREESLDRDDEDSAEGCEPLCADASPDSAAAENEDARRVRSALMSLSPAHREVLVLRHYEDLKFREVAEVLGIPEGTVKSRSAEAMDRLAKALSPSGGDPRMKPERMERFLL